MKIFYHIGRYLLLMQRVIISKPEKHSIYFKQIIREIDNLGVSSIGITAIISIFMGAVITIQTAYGIDNPFVPKYLIGVAARDSMVLEFSSTILSLILAGKVGSNIASEIGTMRVSEQIDALEIMGVNSASYLIMPKIIASVFFNPFLVIMSMSIGIFGGYLAGIFTGVVSPEDYIVGLQYSFRPYYLIYAMIKAVIFAFIIASVSSYHGYYTKGGALEVGKSSTNAVVYSSVLILLFNMILTQLLLV